MASKRPPLNQTQGIEIATNERILIVADPNDGKTTLALKLMDILAPRHLVVVNPGADQKLIDIFGEGRKDVDPNWPSVQHIMPPITDDPKKYKFWWQIAEHGRCLVYIDELDQVGDAHRFNMGLKYIYQRGRRRFVNVIASTQRAVDIPIFAINFSEHIFVGRAAGSDLDRIEKVTKQSFTDLISNRGQHQFSYWQKGSGKPPFYIN